MNDGIVSKIFDWGSHPSFEYNSNPTDWVLGLLLILCVAFLWTRVLHEILK